MKAKLSEWLNSLSGTMGDKYYAVPCPHEPGYCIIRKKPGPRNPKGKRHNLWVMPEAQAAPVRAFKQNQAKASAIYNDPVQRAQYEQEYQAWLRDQSRHGKDYRINGKIVRYLWDYVRIRVNEENQQPK